MFFEAHGTSNASHQFTDEAFCLINNLKTAITIRFYYHCAGSVQVNIIPWVIIRNVCDHRGFHHLCFIYFGSQLDSTGELHGSLPDGRNFRGANRLCPHGP